MTSDDYDRFFRQNLYVPRDFETRPTIIMDRWLKADTRRLRWVSLKSKEGRGNTTLLQRFRRLKLSQPDDGPQGEVLKIFVEGASGEQNGLNPLARQLHELRKATESELRGKLRSRLRRLKLQIKNSSAKKLVFLAVYILIAVTAIFLLIGLNQYFQTDQGHLKTLASWRDFFTDFLPRNSYKIPFWFLISILIGGICSLIITLFNRSLFPPPPDLEKPSPEELEELRAPRKIASAFFDYCCNGRAAILLIDDAHALPKLEQESLCAMFTPEMHAELERADGRLLIVTVTSDATEFGKMVRKEMLSGFAELEVQPFDEFQLRRIADAQLTDADVRSEEDKRNLIELAREDVKALFARRDHKQVEEMGRKFARIEILPDDFNGATLMVYLLVRREPFVTTAWLQQWLPSLEDFVSLFGMSMPADRRTLVKELIGSGMIEMNGKTIVLDPERSEALTQWLMKERISLLSQAHYFWFCEHAAKVGGKLTEDFNVGAASAAEQQDIRQGAWHASQICVLERSTAWLDKVAGLTDEQRWERRREAVSLLFAAAVLSRAEGDSEEADVMMESAKMWLGDSAADPRRDEWLSRIAERLWRDHLVAGEPATRLQLKALAGDCAGLVERPFWRVNERFEKFAQGQSVIPPPPDEAELTDLGLKNLHRLTETLLSIRQRHGFMSPALKDPAVEIRDALEAPGINMAEFSLYQLKAAAASERGQTTEMVEVLRKWRARLQSIQLSDALLGDRVVQTYNLARYWHSLADICQLGIVRAVEKEEEGERNAAITEIVKLLVEACLVPPAEVASLPAYIACEAQDAYEETRRMAVLLGWPTLLMAASFHLGFLLQRTEPQEMRWDEYFDEAIELESRLGWTFHAPAAHKVRWEHIYGQDRELSIKDALNTYEAAKRAGYPLPVILWLDKQMRWMLTSYGTGEEKLRLCAEFYVRWAKELAALPEAAPHRSYSEVGLEQADSLTFAAQALRKLKKFESAEELLDEAEAIIKATEADLSSDEADLSADIVLEEPELEDFETQVFEAGDSELRTVRIDLKLQRAWLHSAQGRTAEYSEQLKDIWRELLPSDRDAANVLGCLLDIESYQGIIYDPWPPAGEPPHLDQLNDSFSLPADWFDGDDPLPLANRFEFRLRQFVRMVVTNRRPTLDNFVWAAQWQWYGQGKFGETAIKFGSAGLGYKRSDEVSSLIEMLLEAVRKYFRQVEEFDRQELEVLRLLMRYSPEANNKYRAAYVEVLDEYRRLREREKHISQRSQVLDWVAAAGWAERYLELLVDEHLRTERLARLLARSGISVAEFNRQLLRQKEVLNSAQIKYREGQIVACMCELEQVLPDPNKQFVFIGDVRSLDLWLRCAREGPLSEFEKVAEREAQFHRSVILYIKQFSELIKEEQVQRLAIMMLNDLQEVGERMRQARRGVPQELGASVKRSA